MRATSKRSRYQARVPSRPSPSASLSLSPPPPPSLRPPPRAPEISTESPNPHPARLQGPRVPPACLPRARSVAPCPGSAIPGSAPGFLLRLRGSWLSRPRSWTGLSWPAVRGSRARSCPAWGVVGSQPSGAAPLPPPSRSNRLRGSFGYPSCGKSPDCFFRRAPIALAAPRISRSSPPGLLLVPNLRQTGPHQSIALNPPCVSPDPCPLPPSPPTNHAPKIRRCIGRGRRAFCESG